MKDVKGAVSFVLMSLAIFVICAALPLMLRGRNPGTPPEGIENSQTAKPEAFSLGEKAEYFIEIWEPQELSGYVTENTAVGAGVMDTIGRIFKLLRTDTAQYQDIAIETVNFYAIECAKNSEIRIIEYYRKWAASWDNWFVIQLDADTGDIYHVYASSGPLFDEAKSLINPDVPGDATSFLRKIGDITGMKLDSLTGPNGSEFEYEAVFNVQGETVRYSVSFQGYQNSYMDIEMTIIG